MPQDPLARKVVNECLKVKEDEQVLISTWENALDFTNSLALEVYKRGAVPLITIFTDQLYHDYLNLVPAEYYAKDQRAFLSLLDKTDAAIWLNGPTDPKVYQQTPAERLGKAFESDKPIMDKYHQRKIRTLNLPLAQMTSVRAATYGFDLAKWRRSFDAALDVDHEKMSQLGKKIALKLQNASKVQITHSNGTSLTFSISNRRPHVRDGVIDKDDIAKGNWSESLPSGTVTVAPVETSADGLIVFDQPRALAGKLLNGLKLSFRDGRVTSFDATDHKATFVNLYENAIGDKDRIGTFSIGINPNASFMGYNTDELVQGSVTIGIGFNKEVGGNNDTAYGHAQTLSRPTVEVDGTPILREGKISI
jgi:aminopeptidase